MFNFTEFRDCVIDPPKQDGHYLVIGVYYGEVGYAHLLEYTVEWGWNTSKYNHASIIDFMDDENHTYHWAEVTTNG